MQVYLMVDKARLGGFCPSSGQVFAFSCGPVSACPLPTTSKTWSGSPGAVGGLSHGLSPALWAGRFSGPEPSQCPLGCCGVCSVVTMFLSGAELPRTHSCSFCGGFSSHLCRVFVIYVGSSCMSVFYREPPTSDLRVILPLRAMLI